ncbi:MAG: hypothetical protein U0075_08870 [Thermomicrobiales bacterium]
MTWACILLDVRNAGHADHDLPGDHDLLGIGVGRVPISIVLISFSLLWGVIGWFASHAFRSIWPDPPSFWPSLLGRTGRCLDRLAS